MSVNPKPMDNIEPLKDVGPIDWSNDKFRREHKTSLSIALQQIVKHGHSDQCIKIEAYGMFFMRHESGNGIELRAKLQNATSALLVTIYSDKLDEKSMFKLINDNFKHTKPSKKRSHGISRKNNR